MVLNKIVTGSLVGILVVTLIGSYYLILVNSAELYCYDQVGDGFFCFNTISKCDQEKKDDEIAESPCNKED